MSRPVQDPPPTEMPPSFNAPGPSAAIDVSCAWLQQCEYYLKIMPINQVYKEVVKQVEKGMRYWVRTNFTMLNKTTYNFKLTCSACNKEHSLLNPPNWRSHRKTCKRGSPSGQVLVRGTCWIVIIQNWYIFLMNYIPALLTFFLMLTCGRTTSMTEPQSCK